MATPNRTAIDNDAVKTELQERIETGLTAKNTAAEKLQRQKIIEALSKSGGSMLDAFEEIRDEINNDPNLDEATRKAINKEVVDMIKSTIRRQVDADPEGVITQAKDLIKSGKEFMNLEETSSEDEAGEGESASESASGSEEGRPKLRVVRPGEAPIKPVRAPSARINVSPEDQALLEAFKKMPSYKNLLACAPVLLKSKRPEVQTFGEKLRLVAILKKAAREEQAAVPEGSRWERAKVTVRNVGGKKRYFWKNWMRGWSDEANLGDKPKYTSRDIPVELTDDECVSFLKCENVREKKESGFGIIFNRILGKIACIKPAKNESTKAKAKAFYETLSEEEVKAFAQAEGCLNENGEADEPKLLQRIELYINALSDHPGYFEETSEKITDLEKGKLLDHLDEVQGVIEELAQFEADHAGELTSGSESGTESEFESGSESGTQGSEHKEPDVYATAKRMYEVIRLQGQTGNAGDKMLYLKYLHFRNKLDPSLKDNVIMLYFLQYILQQHEKGITANLKHNGKGWVPNEEELWSVNEEGNREHFQEDLRQYKEVMDFLRKNGDWKKDSKQLRANLKKICENYEDETALNEDQKKIYAALKKQFPGDIKDRLKYIYKVIIFIEKTPVDIKRLKFQEGKVKPKDQEPPPPEGPRESTDLDIFRRYYATRRRSINKFGDRPDQRDVDESRDRYFKEMRGAFTKDLKNQFKGKRLDTPAERAALSQALVDMLTHERKALLQTEMELQRPATWEKFKTWWRQHPMLRLGISGGLLAGSLLTIPFAPAATLGFVVARGAFNAVSSNVLIEGAWEGIRNRWGKTKNVKTADIGTMSEANVMEALAAHSTLATSQKPGYDGTDRRIPPNAVQTPQDLFNFSSQPAERQRTAIEVMERHNELLREGINNTIQSLPNATPDQIIALAMSYAMQKEADLMRATEAREHEIRKNNVKKKLTALIGALTIGALSIAATWPDKPPVPPAPGPGPVPPAPGPGPVPGASYFTMPESIPGDSDPGLYQALKWKLGLSQSEYMAIQRDPAILRELGKTTLPGNLADATRSMVDSKGAVQTGLNFVHGGDKFEITPALLNNLSRITGDTPANILRRLT